MVVATVLDAGQDIFDREGSDQLQMQGRQV